MRWRARRRSSWALALLGAAAAVLAGACGGGATAAPVPGEAATATGPRVLYVSPDGGRTAACTQKRPCRTLARAYRRARPGDTVLLAAGAYGPQVVALDPRKQPGPSVVFRPAPGARVTTGELRIEGARDLEFRGFAADDLFVIPLNGPDGGPRPEHVTFRNMTTRFFFVRSGKRISILGGSVGGIDEAISSTIGTYPGLPVSEDVLVDGVRFHDVTRDANPTGHIECLFVQESDRVVIRRSRFTRCDVMDVYVNDILGGTITNLTIENNAFDQPGDGGSYAVYVYPRGAGGNVRYNSFGASIIFDGTFEGWSAVGNVGRITVCAEGIAYANNVWENQRCDRTDRRARRVFRDAAGFDLRPRLGSAAIDAGAADSYPATDIDGAPRPRGGRADAGAFEVR